MIEALRKQTESVLQAASDGGSQAAREALIELYDAWGKPEKAAGYRALLHEAENSGASD